MIDLNTIDRDYVIHLDMHHARLTSKKIAILNSEISAKAAYEKIQRGELKSFVAGNEEFAKLEDFIVVRKLNDELGIVTRSPFVLIFSSLYNYITKTPISFPEEKFHPDEADLNAVDFANQVLWLSPEKPEDKEWVKYAREKLYNMLKYGRMTAPDQTLGHYLNEKFGK